MSPDDMINKVSREAQGKDKFIFKHYEKFGDEEFETKHSVDVNGIEDDEESLVKIIQGFFRFLNECGFDSEFVLYKMLEITADAEAVLIEDQLEAHPLTKGDEEFKMFLQKLGEGDPLFLKDVYETFRLKPSLN